MAPHRKGVARLRRVVLLLALSVLGGPASARDGVETSGDIGRLVLPAAALVATFRRHDDAARPQFYRSFAATMLTTYALKEAIGKERPDGSDDDAFPSGHTAVAFHSAVFLHRRYGKPSWWAYVLATYVGFTRVDADEHDAADVLVGAAVGAAAAAWLVEPRPGFSLVPSVGPDSIGLAWHARF